MFKCNFSTYLLIVILIIFMFNTHDKHKLELKLQEQGLEIITLKEDLERAKLQSKNYSISYQEKENEIDNINNLLEKCYLDLANQHKDMETIEEIMNTKEDIKIDNVLVPYKPINNAARERGLDFVNKQFEKIK